ncbi:MAG: hypothetical protein PHC29_00355 [Candidatus Omnitrophica bacterium]|nr:hypothetical protein [Candidatus Omnitrophota bacterium]
MFLLASVFTSSTIVVIWGLLGFFNWIIDGFEIYGKGIISLSETITKILNYLHTHPNNTQITIERDNALKEINELNKKISGLENIIKDNDTEVKTMRSHFKFLLFFIPVALGIIAILIGIAGLQKHTP